jgi:hypothetical protein
MLDLGDKLNIANPNWLMSYREKLAIIGLLQCLKPKKVIEFGYHRGGATKWLSQFAEKLISVDVNEFVSEASKKYSNVEPWKCTTEEAIKKIKVENLSFDLAIIDADHSKKAVANDVSGIIPHAEVILMHDSFNPACRRGMLDALKSQNSHAFYLDFMPSILKEDGLWGGFAIAWKSENPGLKKEFLGEKSSYSLVWLQSIFHLKSMLLQLKHFLSRVEQSSISKVRIFAGKILGK